MADDNLERVMQSASEDFSRAEFGRAKDRLRAIIRESPLHQPALELMGRIYFEHRDYRNAVMYWSRANYWEEPMRYACKRVFLATTRALNKERIHAARYQLYAFAGCTPPADLAQKLASYQHAYFKLDEKRSRQLGLSCAPLAGGSMMLLLGMLSVILGGGWSSLAWIIVFALTATVVVFGINFWSYMQASKLFKRAMETFTRGQDSQH